MSNRPDFDHNLATDLPTSIKAMITKYGNAARAYAWKGAAHPEDADAITEQFQIARYNLERTILTHLNKD